jgi:hypothetical protein
LRPARPTGSGFAIGKSAACRARDSGGAIAPTTIHTYRKATVFGRIVAEILFCRRQKRLQRKARFAALAAKAPKEFFLFRYSSFFYFFDHWFFDD